MKRENCEHYPCHFEGQDCTLCFCPFYPCYNRKLGRMLNGNGGKGVWDCSGCYLVHEEEVVREILERSMRGESLESIWKNVMEPLACRL
ncbi:cysteine-rich small domain-containing protein [Methermicoccus shengliensis]|uniref:Cysteine-rich small domain-containing protein n=1 Tax=Methermicoccus shengliensis TaxID=660064 RepID=A0A832VWU1_9EURY|nr:cysteine-rich small domain-containing protein [Methermicoccus shengliensis]KUK04483.1 MAG: Histidinol-phosphate aminotransferase [Euryarchaeota archaeon 55_53]KUK30110.1 MAG: Histidinol-phosphate aminotransferase [Methanosarcinales archeaon 56_1174]MDI3487474.1 threonine-phosphate decarboxylase [Methanosarcinales archaeon]HIH69183.1 hypothetical protein [Methermicoccus shengliensis]